LWEEGDNAAKITPVHSMQACSATERRDAARRAGYSASAESFTMLNYVQLLISICFPDIIQTYPHRQWFLE